MCICGVFVCDIGGKYRWRHIFFVRHQFIVIAFNCLLNLFWIFVAFFIKVILSNMEITNNSFVFCFCCTCLTYYNTNTHLSRILIQIEKESRFTHTLCLFYLFYIAFPCHLRKKTIHLKYSAVYSRVFRYGSCFVVCLCSVSS